MSFKLVLILLILLILRCFNLKDNQNKLKKYLYNYLSAITSARYGNLKIKSPKGVDKLTSQLSKNTNALLESISDRDSMICEYIEKEKESQNLKQDFISSLAHDFKVPILAQDNAYDLILAGNFGELSEVQRHVIENLKISNNDLKNLVTDLLDAHKLENQGFELNIENTNINNLIKEVIEQNNSILTIKNKVINFQNELEINAKIDAFLIKRALNNLISNAIFYGKNSKYIDIILNKTSENIEISVIDDGDGIKEDINSLFKKYYTQAKKYSNIGIGLGLYIVSKIVSAHNGTVVAYNTKNKGACFTLKIPL